MPQLVKFNKKKFILVVVFLSEIAVLLTLVAVFSIKYHKTPKPNITKLNRENLIFENADNLKYFYEPKPNTLDVNGEPDWLPYKPTYTINADGLREKFNYEVQKPPKTYRIITLGDSFTYGQFVRDNEVWAKVLEDNLNNQSCPGVSKFEVINLGVQGYDIEYSKERFKLRGQKYQPDMVIWLLKSDDWQEINEKILPEVEAFTKQRSGYIMPTREFNIWVEAYRHLKEKFGKDQILRYQTNALRSINDLFKGTLIIYSPTIFWANDINTTTPTKQFVKDRPNSYWLLDPTPFDKISTLYPDNHPNVKGHQIIAQNILDFIKTNNLLPCN